jgi:hypothetical protein
MTNTLEKLPTKEVRFKSTSQTSKISSSFFTETNEQEKNLSPSQTKKKNTLIYSMICTSK